MTSTDDLLRELYRMGYDTALRDAANDVARIRQHGLRAHENYGPSDLSIERWLRDRAWNKVSTSSMS